MSEFFVDKDRKVQRMSEQQLRERLRKNKFSGMELVRRFDEEQWRPLHESPMFRDEVAFEGLPEDAARWRIGRGFVIHFAIYLGVSMLTGFAAPIVIFWGIGIVLHGARAMPPLLALHREGKLPILRGKSSKPSIAAGGTAPHAALPPQPIAERRSTEPHAVVPSPHPRMSSAVAPTIDPNALTAAVSPAGAQQLGFDPTIGLPAAGGMPTAGSAPGTGTGPSNIEDRQLRASVRGKLFGGDAVAPVRVGRYRLDEKIGAGGMGIVYRALDETLDRPVAVKLLRPGYDAESGTERLQREARAMARLSHPHVVTVHDVGVVDGAVFVAMEYVDGPTLRAWLQESRSVGDILHVLVQAAQGVAAAHAAELIHRDFKPENVIVGTDGRVRVLDFGLAKPIDHASAKELITQTGTIMGTPRYMAPEQFRGEPADARTDQFALGVVFYESVFGMHPYEPQGARSLPQSVLKGELRQPRPRADVSGALRDAILKAVAHDPEARHESIEAMVAALGPIPSTRDEFASLAATVRRLLHRRDGGTQASMLEALGNIETVVAELDAKASMLGGMTGSKETEELERERDEAKKRLEASGGGPAQGLLRKHVETLEQRLQGIERAREVVERLRTRRAVAENQLRQLHLDLSRAEASDADLPDLTDPLQELRFEVDAAQEVEALLRD